jgi:hypothetical protein
VTNAVPASLVRFRQEFDQAVRRDRTFAQSRRRRFVPVRIAVAGLAVGAVALGILSVVSNDAPSIVGTASAKSIVRLAAASIKVSPSSILHVDMIGVQQNGDGSSATWQSESWQQESAPYDRRQIETHPGQAPTETAIADGADQVYDPAANTIYVDVPGTATPHARPTFDIEPGSTAGTYRLRLPALPAKGVTSQKTLVISAAQAKALRDGADVIGWTLYKHAGGLAATAAVVPASSRSGSVGPNPEPNPDSQAFADEILALLRSGDARVVGPATVDGRNTIKIESADGSTTYFVDSASYAPVELDTRGTDGGTSLRFRTYERLAGAAASNSVLSLVAQHPTATVDRSATDYQDAQARLFPTG